MTNLLRNKIAQNAGWLIFGKIAQMLIGLIVGVLTARYLGPSDYGLIHYAAAYTSLFLSVATLGLQGILVKELLDAPHERGVILGSALILQSAAGAASTVAILVLSTLLDGTAGIAVTALYSLSLIFRVGEVFYFYFQAVGRAKCSALAALIAYTVTAGYKVFLLAAGKSVVWFAATAALDNVCMGAVLFAFYRRDGGERLRFDARTASRLLRRGAHFILPGVMVAVYTAADKLMLKHLCGQTQVGYYSTAVGVCGMWSFVLTAIIDSCAPHLMDAHADKALFEKRTRRLYAAIFYLSTAVSAALCVLAKPIVTLLYGREYLGAVAPLRIVTWYTAFAYLGVARNTWVVCENAQKHLLWVYLSSALGNIALNAVLIPRYGASGAAFATLVTQIIGTIVAPLCVRALRRNAVLTVQGICLRKLR